MCNAGHGGAQRPKVYIGDISLEVWGRKGEWNFGLFRHHLWSKFVLYTSQQMPPLEIMGPLSLSDDWVSQTDVLFDTQSEAKEQAERWFSEWVINQFLEHRPSMEVGV